MRKRKPLIGYQEPLPDYIIERQREIIEGQLRKNISKEFEIPSEFNEAIKKAVIEGELLLKGTKDYHLKKIGEKAFFVLQYYPIDGLNIHGSKIIAVAKRLLYEYNSKCRPSDRKKFPERVKNIKYIHHNK